MMATARARFRSAERELDKAHNAPAGPATTEHLLWAIAFGVLSVAAALGTDQPPLSERSATDRCICRPDGTEAHASDCPENNESPVGATTEPSTTPEGI